MINKYLWILDKKWEIWSWCGQIFERNRVLWESGAENVFCFASPRCLLPLVFIYLLFNLNPDRWCQNGSQSICWFYVWFDNDDGAADSTCAHQDSIGIWIYLQRAQDQRLWRTQLNVNGYVLENIEAIWYFGASWLKGGDSECVWECTVCAWIPLWWCIEKRLSPSRSFLRRSGNAEHRQRGRTFARVCACTLKPSKCSQLKRNPRTWLKRHTSSVAIFLSLSHNFLFSSHSLSRELRSPPSAGVSDFSLFSSTFTAQISALFAHKMCFILSEMCVHGV